jgi:hypothetical protein
VLSQVSAVVKMIRIVRHIKIAWDFFAWWRNFKSRSRITDQDQRIFWLKERTVVNQNPPGRKEGEWSGMSNEVTCLYSVTLNKTQKRGPCGYTRRRIRQSAQFINY